MFVNKFDFKQKNVIFFAIYFNYFYMFKDLQKIFSNIFMLYRNFFHWNISKLLIFIFSIVLWALLTIPFFATTLIIAQFDPVPWNNIFASFLYTQWVSMEFVTAFQNYFWYMLIQLFFWITIVFVFIFWIQYWKICLYKLNLSYLSWNKLWFFKNIYFSPKKISKYFWIVSFLSLMVLLPILFFILLTILIILLTWGLTNFVNLVNSSANYYMLLNVYLILSLIIVSFSIIYTIYRYGFSLAILLEDWYADSSCWVLLKKSREVTKWLVFFKVFISYLVVWIVIFLISFLVLVIIWTGLNYSWVNVMNYDSIMDNITNILAYLFLYGVTEMLFISVYDIYFRSKVTQITEEDSLEEDIDEYVYENIEIKEEVKEEVKEETKNDLLK